MDKQFLVFCEFDTFCQGWERDWGYFLVLASDFPFACTKLKEHSIDKGENNPRGFRNHTVE